MKNYEITSMVKRFMVMLFKDKDKLASLVKVMKLEKYFKVDGEIRINFSKINRMNMNQLEGLLNDFDFLEWEFNQIL